MASVLMDEIDLIFKRAFDLLEVAESNINNDFFPWKNLNNGMFNIFVY